MSFTESKIIKQITILPESGAINVQWANQVLKNGTVISETFERCAYCADPEGVSAAIGGVIWVEAGAIKCRNSAGDVVSLAFV